MTCTKKKFEEAIIELATQIELKNKYEFNLNVSELTLPEIVKQLGYDLFINGFCHHDITHENKKYYQLILAYSNELKENWIVEFKI